MKTAHKLPPRKVYVKVNSDFDATGAVTPKVIIWEDGRSFRIEAIRDFRPACTMESGRSGDCYTVIIHGEQKYLFFERTGAMFGSRLGRWWVECAAN